jgi:hypothetical protein
VPTGIKIPVQVDRTGRTAMISGDDLNRQLIAIALADDENENAFQQQIGLGEAMIFGGDTPTLRAQILRRLFTIFVDFEARKIFRLVKETIEWSKNVENGDLILSFYYIDLESDSPQFFKKAFTTRI